MINKTKKTINKSGIYFTPRLDNAIRVATLAHAKQNRKGMDIPYIVHPYSVMLIASEATNDEDTLIACLMHDVLEDVSDRYSQQQMLDEFGKNIVEIVKGVTKNSQIKDWHQQSAAYMDNLLNNAPDESIIVACSDKIHNIMSTLHDYERIGDKLWSRFRSSKEDRLWYYEKVYEILSIRLPNLPIRKKYFDLMIDLNKIVKYKF